MVGQAESKTEEVEKVRISKCKHSQLVGLKFGEELETEEYWVCQELPCIKAYLYEVR
jgi:hypothetical protein